MLKPLCNPFTLKYATQVGLNRKYVKKKGEGEQKTIESMLGSPVKDIYKNTKKQIQTWKGRRKN